MSALPKPAAPAAPDLALVPAPEFDLDATIRECLATSTNANPRDIAIDVAARIPDAVLADVVARLLPTRIGWVIRQDRRQGRYNAHRRARRGTGEAGGRAARTPTGIDNYTTDAPVPEGQGRWRDLADVTHDLKRWRVAIDGRWMILGDCTAEHIKIAILAYRKLAQANDALADRYCTIRDEMIKRDAPTVSALPDDLVREVLSQ